MSDVKLRFHSGLILCALAFLFCACATSPIRKNENLMALKNVENGEHRIKLNGVYHWYRVSGTEHKKPPIILVHGGPGGSSYQLENAIGKKLAQRFTVVAYDQRGCGRSDKPKDGNYSLTSLTKDLEEFRKALSVEKISLLGSSFGGELALEYALSHPNRVEHLVLEGPMDGDYEGVMQLQFHNFTRIASPQLKKEIQLIWAQEKKPVSERYFEMWGKIDRNTVDKFIFHRSEHAARVRKIWESDGQESNEVMGESIFSHKPNPPLLAERVKKIEVPTLILVGRFDLNTGIPLAEKLHKAIPNSKLKIFEESGHFPHIEETDLFVSETADFLVAAIFFCPSARVTGFVSAARYPSSTRFGFELFPSIRANELSRAA